MEKGFWAKLQKPIIGQAPMDGVTDAPFRFITAKYGKPDLHITEFTSVEGICHGAVKSLKAFVYDEIERPVVAQIFGSEPESFYKSAFVVCELGFDGLDINMGCPAKNVASKGAGAALILDPERAKKIIRRTKDAVNDWANGKKINDVGLPEEIVEYVLNQQRSFKITPKKIPVSVKTRIGYNEIAVEEWVKHLLEEEPANITIHGRTLKQMYSGTADWEAIGQAAKIIHQAGITVLGNGDIHSLEEGHERVKNYGVDGFLIGRASFGNPWIFSSEKKQVQPEESLKIAVEHAHLYEKIFQGDHFVPMRKHLAWYCRGFHGASEVRQQLMKANNAKEVQEMLMDFSSKES